MEAGTHFAPQQVQSPPPGATRAKLTGLQLRIDYRELRLHATRGCARRNSDGRLRAGRRARVSNSLLLRTWGALLRSWRPVRPPSTPPNSSLSPRNVVDEDSSPAIPDVGKLIEFPRALYLGPAVNPYELADPVLEAPRILDVPESVPAPPPPLSDIELEPEGEEIDPRLLEPVLDVAPLPQRVFAGVVDAVVVLGAAALFGAIALKIAGPALFADRRTALIAIAVVPTILWAMYNYLLLVHGGRTLGMIHGKAAACNLRNATGGTKRQKIPSLCHAALVPSLGDRACLGLHR